MATEPTRPGLPRPAILIALLLALLFVTGAVYKWVDKEGKVQYSDKPPPGQAAQTVTVAPGPTAEQQMQAQSRLQALKESAQSEAAANEAARTERQSAEQSQMVEAELAVQVCADARVQRMTLDLQMPIYRRSGSRERVYLADADRPAEKQRMDETIAQFCSDDPAARAAEQRRFLELSLGRRPACVELRVALDEIRTKPDRESAEQVQQLTDRLNTYRCYPVPIEQVWLAQMDYQLRAPTDE
ncbi:MAG: hypothetical protein RL261_2355 [Pseudomonadota bacterium]